MTIDLDKPAGRIFARAYLLPLSLGGETCGDAWGMLLKDPGKPWTLVFRVRTYVSDDPHDGRDYKSWMRASFEGCSDDEAVEKCDTFWKELATSPSSVLPLCPGKLDITDLRGLTGDALMQVMLRQPNMHPRPTSTGGDA